MTQRKWPGFIWFWGVIPLILLDQLSKFGVLHYLKPGQSMAIFPGLNFYLAYNPGIAFSLFNQKTGWMPLFLIALITGISLFVTIWLARTPRHDRMTGIALAMILGGAIGNLLDRINYGHVIDFIDVYIGSWHWYTFNLADSFITVGAGILVLSILLTQDPEKVTGK